MTPAEAARKALDEIHRRLDSAMEYAIASTTTVALSMGRMKQTTLEGYE